MQMGKKQLHDRGIVLCGGKTVKQKIALRRFGCRCAILKERSPSCGSSAVYDGSFSGRVVPGAGVAAALLMENGVRVFSEENFEKLFETEEFRDEGGSEA